MHTLTTYTLSIPPYIYHIIISIDEAELAMRNLDKSGRGFLTNDKVFKLMTQQMEQQKQLFRFKKIMIG